MKTSLKFLYTGIASLAVATGFAVTPAIAELSLVDPGIPNADDPYPADNGSGGFPQWYQDSKGLKLDLCLAPSIDRTPPGYCLTEPPNPDALAQVDGFDPAASNFPDEAFWWTAEAEVTRNNGRAILVLATEAAFANEEAIDGDQVVFNRTRIRVQGLGLRNGVKYRVTYPYGVKTLTATQPDPRKPAVINVTEDFGCAVTATAECNFRDVLLATGNRGRTTNPIGKPWLTWDSTLPAPPAGYIGDPNVEHRVTGSPNNTNFFRVQEIKTDGTLGVVIANTNLFSVSGKIHVDNPPAAQ